MPIQRYLCADCNRVFEFLFPTSEDPRQPRCPRCGASPLERQLSQFAFVRGGKNPLAAIPRVEDEAEAEPEAASTAKAEAEADDLDRSSDPPEQDPGLYKLWEHCVEGEGEAHPIPRRRKRVTESGEQAEREPEA